MNNNEDRFDDEGKIHDRERLKELQSLSLSLEKLVLHLQE